MPYVLVNTLMAIPGCSVGTVISCHRTEEKAIKAMEKGAWKVPRYGGKDHYWPLAIYKLAKHPKYRHIGLSEITPNS